MNRVPHHKLRKIYAREFTEQDRDMFQAKKRGFIHVVREEIPGNPRLAPIHDVKQWLDETYDLRDGHGYYLIKPVMDERIWAFADKNHAFAFRMRWT